MVFDAVQGLDYDQIFLFFFVLFDYCLDRCEMLLVREVDVVEKWTLTRQEATGQLKTLSMPELRLLLSLLWFKAGILLHLKDEPDLCGVTEIRNCHVGNLLDEGVTSEFQLVFAFLDEVSELKRLKLHNSSNT